MTNPETSLRETLHEIVRTNIVTADVLQADEDDLAWLNHIKPILVEYIKVRAQLSRTYYFWLISAYKEKRAKMITNFFLDMGIYCFYKKDETDEIYSIYTNLAIMPELNQ